MVEIDRLRSVILLSFLTPEMLEKVHKIGAVERYEAEEYILLKGSTANCLYSILEGQVAIELKKGVALQTIEPNHTFGLSSVIDIFERKSVSYARALKPTSVFVCKASDLESLFEENFRLGFIFMKRIAKILKTRLEARDAELGKVLGSDSV